MRSTAYACALLAFFPLNEGTVWDYMGRDTGRAERQVVVGRTVVLGDSVSVVEFQNSDSNEGLQQMWFVDSTAVRFTGFQRPKEGDGVLYRPPLRMVELPVENGATWIDTVDVLLLPDTTFVASVTIEFEVMAAESTLVPKGTFFSYEIEQRTAEPAPEMLQRYALTGRRGELGTVWWSDGRGRIRYVGDDAYELTSFTPTPVIRTSWGELRRILGR